MAQLTTKAIRSMTLPEGKASVLVTIPHSHLAVSIGKTRRTFYGVLYREGRYVKKPLGDADVYTLEEAHEMARDFVKRVEQPAKATVTLEEALDEYIATWSVPGKKRRIMPTTADQYRKAFVRLVPHHMRETPLREVTEDEATALFDRIASRTPQMANLVANILNMVAKFKRLPPLVDANHIIKSPPRKPRADVQTWLRVAKTETTPYHQAMVLAVMTGIRKEALTSLLWTDLDLDAGTVTLRNNKGWKGVPVTLPLGSHAVAMFRTLPRLSVYVFAGSRGHIRDIVREREKKAHGITAHDGRHHMKDVAVSLGAHPYEIKLLRGDRADKSEAWQGYGEQGPLAARGLAEKLSERVNSLLTIGESALT